MPVPRQCPPGVSPLVPMSARYAGDLLLGFIGHGQRRAAAAARPAAAGRPGLGV